MIVEILNVGSEILIGDILNTNVRYLSLKLSEIGLDVLWHSSVGDNLKRLQKAITIALERSDIVVITGGLGPTTDDITKEAVSLVVEKELIEDLKIKKKLEERFKTLNKTITKNNYKQCLIVKDAKIFENKVGTAPAMIVEHNSKIIILLPGPPIEMKKIFEEQIILFLKQFVKGCIFSKNIYIYGLSESVVDEKICNFLKMKNPTVGIYDELGQVRLRVTAKCDNLKYCKEKVDEIVEQIKIKLEPYVYGVDIKNMQNALVNILKLKKKTLAIAESCTGGLISSKIVDIPGCSEILKMGVVCYCNESKISLVKVSAASLKKHGAVSSCVAKEMAFGVRIIANADIGISTTGLAGPTKTNSNKPVGLVYVGISTKKETKAYKLFIPNKEGERNKIRNLAAIFAMNKTRETVLLDN